MDIIEQEVSLVGLQFRMKAAERMVLAENVKRRRGIRVELRRDAENEYDENAVAVYSTGVDERHIGYLAREVAAVLAPMLDDGSLTVRSAKLIEVEKPEEYRRVTGTLALVLAKG